MQVISFEEALEQVRATGAVYYYNTELEAKVKVNLKRQPNELRTLVTRFFYKTGTEDNQPTDIITIARANAERLWFRTREEMETWLFIRNSSND